MNAFTKDLLVTGAKLFLICAVAALALGLVNEITAPIIAENRATVLQNALSSLVSQGEIGEYVEIGDFTVQGYYPVTDSSGGVVSYIVNLSAFGYGGGMTVVASFESDGTVIAARLLTNNETPGLGKLAESADYMLKYIGLRGDAIPIRRDMLSREDSDAVTGATITFAGIGRVLQDASRFVAGLEATR